MRWFLAVLPGIALLVSCGDDRMTPDDTTGQPQENQLVFDDEPEGLMTLEEALTAPPPPARKTFRPPGPPNQGYVGLTKAKAIARAKAFGMRYRVIREDGVAALRTMDIKGGRMNFVIEDNMVVEARDY